MAIMVMCGVFFVGAITRMFSGPIFGRVLNRRLARRFADLLSQGGSTGFAESPYRNAVVARIHSLECENRALKDKLREQEAKLAEVRQEIIEERWYRAQDIRRTRPMTTHDAQPLGGVSAVGFCCLLLATGFMLVSLSLIPTGARAVSRTSSELHAHPTMIDLPSRTAGGELPAPEQLTVLVHVLLPSEEPAWCYEGRFMLQPTFALLDLSEDGEWVRIVWFLATYDPGPPPIPSFRL